MSEIWRLGPPPNAVERWGESFAAALLALGAAGEMTQLATDRGIHLVKPTGRQPGLDQVRERLESRIRLERRSRAMDDLVTELKKTTPVELDEKVRGAVDPTANGTGTAQAAP